MNTHHAINYVELPVHDMKAARAFYAKAFGWEFNDYGPEYSGIKGEGRELGGLREEPGYAGVRGGPLVVLFSKDLDATVKGVSAAGGRIITPPFEFPGGRRFHFTDPSGNELAVWSEK
jgi:predicted enzyme related to lactoylglutathione lyase